MTIEDVINYFGSGYKLNLLTNMSKTTFHNWKKKGYVPISTQIKLESFTKGKLKADLNHAK